MLSSYHQRLKEQLKQLGDLPIPSVEAIVHSEKLHHFIQNKMLENGGFVNFQDFMELALYAPGLGYYAAGAQKIGESGDFVTAPEISPLFSDCLAMQIAQVLGVIEHPQILELGAGQGTMAADILLRLEELDTLPQYYFILERSAELRERQQHYLQKHIPHLFSKVQWLNELPQKGFKGAIVANEVIDAMGVRLIESQDGELFEKVVVSHEDKFFFEFKKADQDIEKWYQARQIAHDLPENYQTEVNFLQSVWMESLADFLEEGIILLLDYGFPAAEYYHSQRSGTLMCHYRHHAHSDPLVLLGLQDITAHVDFTSLAETGFAKGLGVSGYIDQANFLTNCGLLERMTELAGEKAEVMLRYSQQAKILMLPTEMGEIFKVIAFTKNVSLPYLVGFQRGDRRGRL